ncbi:MAG: GNAT family N-acetyltransferase [Myxococcales bacterium]|nr:GNAT family N-acetyltransferase [Myxococcales bacterium]
MDVMLREVTMANFGAVIRCRVADDQQAFVAPNVESLAEAYTNPRLVPLAIYDEALIGRVANAEDPVRGFVMYQVWDEIGFIKRLMVAPDHQRRGYGRAAMCEVVRRLKLHPSVRRIATSYHRDNHAARDLYLSLGFTRPIEMDSDIEEYVALDWDPVSGTPPIR